MKETLIEFRTAKLAKEKGFDINCSKCFRLDYPKYGKLETCFISYDEDDGWIEYNHHRGTDVKIDVNSFVFVPTQNLLQLWLRETHDIHVQILIWSWLDRTYCYRIHTPEHYIPSSGSYLLPDDVIVGTYEDTLEEGLQRALKLIK